MASKPNQVVVKVENLTKTFRIPTEASSGIKQKLINLLKGRKGYREFTPLKDISLEIEQGDFFGIVGRNGSGKSTLLKSIANIYTPTKGSVHVKGTLVPFIELGVGFNPELTGRENVFLNGALLGFGRKEMESMYDDIVEFAEIGDFMEEKLKNYSSGMQVRLAFSIAIKAEGDILLLDEVLAVGDEEFQRKCFSYFAELKKNKRTVILVTHSMESVQQYCTKAIMIEGGSIVKQGKTSEVAQAYRELFMEAEEKTEYNKEDGSSINKNLSVKINYKNNVSKLNFNVSLMPKVDIADAVITFVINRDNGEIVYRWTSDEKIPKTFNIVKDKQALLDIEIDNIFPNGVFSVEVGVKSRDRTVVYADFANAKQFEIINRGSHNQDIFWKPGEKVELEV